MGVLGNKEFGGKNNESFDSSEDSDGPKTKKTKQAIQPGKLPQCFVYVWIVMFKMVNKYVWTKYNSQ